MPPGRKLMEELWRHRSGWKAIEGLWNDAFLNKRRVERLRAARSGPAEPPPPLVIADDGEALGYEFLTLNLSPATPVADPAPPPPPPVPTPPPPPPSPTPPPPPPPGPTPPPSPTLPPDAVLRAWRNSSVFTYGKLAAMGLVAAFLLYLFWRRARGWNVGGGDDIGGPDPGEGCGMHGAEGRGLLDALGVVLGQEINDGDGQGGGGNPLLIRRGVPSDLQLQALFLSGGDLGADFLKALSIIDSTCNISVKLVLGMKIKARALERLKIILERDDSSCRDMSLPWLFSLAENGHGMLVPRNAFRQTNYNSAGFQCYKLPEHHLPPGMSLVGVSVTDAGESDEKSALVSWIWSLNKIKLKDVIERCSPKGVFVLRC